MNRCTLHVIVALALLAAAANPSWGQAGRQPPQIGYVWPAGGQAGQTFEVIVGGQTLSDKAQPLISGEGVQAELLAYMRPLSQKEINAIRDILNEAQKQARAEAKDGKAPTQAVIRDQFLQMAKEKGITDAQVAGFDQSRRDRSDAKRQLNPQLAESVSIRITIAPDAAPGVRELRLATPTGLSNPLVFDVGRLPETREAEADTPPGPTAVPSLPIVLNGRIMPGETDRFRFQARKGQNLLVDVSARRLIPYLADAVPGWFQAVVAVYGPDGREAAYADDFRFDPDPALLFSVPEDGEYELAIRDSIYRGREDFVYRIALGELPFVTGVFPMGARRGEKTAVTLTGWNLPADQTRQEVLFETAGPQSIRAGAQGLEWNALPFAVGDLPECVEREPDDTAAAAMKTTLPTIVNGRIDRPGDWDVFVFDAAAGEQIVAEVQARRLGSPLDSLLRLTDADGRVLAANDDSVDRAAGLVTHHADSLLSASIARTGKYFLWLGDTQGHGSPAHGYRLRVSRPRPDFELRVVPSALSLRGGGTVPIRVVAVRRDGFAGDIKLRLVDAPEGFALSGWLPAGQEEARLTLSVPAKPAQPLTELRLEGLATLDGRELRRQAVAADDRMQAFAYQHLVPARSWTVAVEAVRWAAVPWTMSTEQPVKLTPGGTASVGLKAPVRPAQGDIRLVLNDPPDGITVRSVTPVAGGVTVVLHAAAGIVKPGLKGNLILDAFQERKITTTNPAVQPTRRVPLGPLPAIPFEITPE